jgi:hypothetical protein
LSANAIIIPEMPPARGYEGIGKAEVAPRYEDITQDGRVVLTSLMPGVGVAVWRELLSKMPALEAFRAQGILPILRRLVICEGPNAGPFSVHVPFSFEGTWRLAREAGGDRIFVNMWVEAFAPIAHTLGPPPARAAERVLLGRIFAEHVVTRPFGPPEERKVTRIDPASGLPAVPEDEHPFLSHEELVPAALRTSLTPADPPTVTFGMMHTDSNQHVNSLVYPRVFEELVVRRHGDAKLLARAIEMRWRKPFFAGDRARVALTIEGDHAVGTFAPEASSDRASCVIAMTLR